jgi:hypothetical protein
MLIDPKNVVFETKDDVIDYVSKGIFPPREEHFNQVMNKVRTPDEKNDPTLMCKKGREVVIDNTVIPESDREVLGDVLTRVYGNRVEKRDTILTLAGLGIAGVLLYGLFGPEKNDREIIVDATLTGELEKGEYVDKCGNTITIF